MARALCLPPHAVASAAAVASASSSLRGACSCSQMLLPFHPWLPTCLLSGFCVRERTRRVTQERGEREGRGRKREEEGGSATSMLAPARCGPLSCAHCGRLTWAGARREHQWRWATWSLVLPSIMLIHLGLRAWPRPGAVPIRAACVVAAIATSLCTRTHSVLSAGRLACTQT